MPFAKVTALVACLPQDVRNGDFLRAERPARRERAVAVGMPSRGKAAACRRATRVRSVKAVHPQTGRGYFVEHGRFDMRSAVVAGLLPAVIVAHEEHNVRCRSESQ